MDWLDYDMIMLYVVRSSPKVMNSLEIMFISYYNIKMANILVEILKATLVPNA